MVGDHDESLEKRRAQLGAELASKRASTGDVERGDASAEVSRKGFAEALKLSSEFVSAIIVGALLGYFLDRLAGTGPWGMIIFLLLGFCAGVLNVLRVAGRVSTPTVGGSETDKK
jgi:ATP synthase protein I